MLTAPIMLLGNPPDPPSPQGFTGLTSDQIEARVPGMTGYIGSISRQLGNFMLAMGVFMTATAAFPFRRGERWAWYAMWAAPLMHFIQFANSRGGNGWWADLGLGVFTSAALAWVYRLFFPKGPRA